MKLYDFNKQTVLKYLFKSFYNCLVQASELIEARLLPFRKKLPPSEEQKVSL